MPPYPDNNRIADILDDVADILEFRDDNPHRVRAYRRAADRIRDFDDSVSDRYARRGTAGLRSIEGVGERLSATIAEIAETGELGLLTRLQSELSPVDVFSRLPGIGPELAKRIVDELDVSTLEELEEAVHDGRLVDVDGIGASKATGIGHALAGMLNRGARRRARHRQVDDESSGDDRPPLPVALLLDLDAEYRRRAQTGSLRYIAPRRFNPDNEKWLPIMEVERAGIAFTVVFSNTRRAHELGRTDDWVVIYADDGDDGRQFTVVTATSGPLQGKRVVRGRERDTRRFYEKQNRSTGQAP